VQLLTGRINTEGLFYEIRRDGSRYFSPERIQLLLMTLAFSFQYQFEICKNKSIAACKVDVDSQWVPLDQFLSDSGDDSGG
jgi:hypothetical protein